LNKNTVSVLCFHSISDNPDRYSINLETFEHQIKKIANNARFVKLNDVVESLKDKKLKTPCVAITLDDGFADVTKILPLTKKYQIPITLFVLSEPQNANQKEIQNNQRFLNTQELKELISHGWTIGCHSKTHADFSTLNEENLKNEISAAKNTLEKNLGIPIKYFAYPKGVFNDKIINIVKEAGYEAAFVVSPNNIETTTNKWKIPRVVIDRTHSSQEFPALYSKTTFFLRKITQPLRLWNIFLQTEKINETK
jgi:peptidoglycan/xylan/chitin deacetylase (PgdA/CDA1 family)